MATINMASKYDTLKDVAKNNIIKHFDQSYYSPNLIDNKDVFNFNHKGFFITIVDASEHEITRCGFFQDNQVNLVDSVLKVVHDILNVFKIKNVSFDEFNTSKIYCTIITDCVYIPDSLSWDENKDGVMFQWGQKYKGFYLPHQIKKIKASKIEIMDMLCTHQCGLISNLWKLPEGLVYILKCVSF